MEHNVCMLIPRQFVNPSYMKRTTPIMKTFQVGRHNSVCCCLAFCLFVWSFVYLFVLSFFRSSLVPSFACSFVCSFVVRSCVRFFVCLSINLLYLCFQSSRQTLTVTIRHQALVKLDDIKPSESVQHSQKNNYKFYKRIST